MENDDDFKWTTLHESWQRLRWARQRAGMTQEDFASSVGLGRTGYIKYEANPDQSQSTPMTADKAMLFARKLRIRWEWLLEEKGAPWIEDSDQRRMTRQQERAVDLLEGQPEEEQDRIVSALELLVRRTGTTG